MFIITALIKAKTYIGTPIWEEPTSQLVALGVDRGTYGSGELCWMNLYDSDVKRFESIEKAEKCWREEKAFIYGDAEILQVGICELVIDKIKNLTL